MTADLHARILAAVEETAREAPRVHRQDCNLVHRGADAFGDWEDCDCSEPATVLRRCEADRRVLERHGLNTYGGSASCDWCSGDEYPYPWPCPDVLDLAAAYGVTVEEGATR